MQTKKVLDLPNCKIYHEKEGFAVYMKMANGGWLKNNTHANSLEGCIAALALSIDVVAGKVWPKAVVSGLPDDTTSRKITRLDQLPGATEEN